MDRNSALAIAIGALTWAGCGNTPPGNGPCDGADPSPTCNQECAPPPAAETCPPGFHCGDDGRCDAACTPGGDECGSGRVCTADGRCVGVDTPDAGPTVDADCPSVTFTAAQVIPTVELLIDQSGSMDIEFSAGPPSVDRWTAVKHALTDPTTGVVTELAGQVYFGASLYTGGGACPTLTSTTGRALNNFAAIDALLEGNGPAGDTPTGDSIDEVIADFAANPPVAGSPPIIVLATDGEPDTCEVPNPQNGQAEAIAAAQAAFTAGIRLFILSVGNDVSTTHQQQMANAGAGQDVLTGTAPYFPADTPQELRNAFTTIIGGVQSCVLDLDGQIDPAQAGSGSVTLNGVPLTFGTEWTAPSGTTIELIGQACLDLKSTTNPTVTANFPCGAVIE